MCIYGHCIRSFACRQPRLSSLKRFFQHNNIIYTYYISVCVSNFSDVTNKICALTETYNNKIFCVLTFPQPFSLNTVVVYYEIPIRFTVI